MKLIALKTKCAMALLIAGIFAMGPALAEKPSWAGNDKGGKNDRGDQRDDRKNDRNNDRKGDDRNSRKDNDRRSDSDRRHFQPQQHVVVRDYYAEHYRGRRCPPGLAKKNNGCMPPGQAKKWRVGYQLPRDVIYYSVPAPLVVQIGPPPSGHRYVRVAGDILLLAIGTGMVVDAIQDLGGM
ncbi:MAG: RcnB family protein [Sulfuritalea sp.]|jgi:Ni/Co efflux regulator RcnB|nr:RcnB family protein [Sulfuritalea sp.]MDP1983127.1 RcnB family protein [Sulfuritalea sp.]